MAAILTVALFSSTVSILFGIAAIITVLSGVDRTRRACKDVEMSRYPAYPAPLKSQADKRARAMFLAHCTPEQLHSWETSGYIDVVGSCGTFYQLYNWNKEQMTFNVYYLRGDVNTPLCVVTVENLPQYDRFLAQKILIETDERRFRSYTPHHI